MLESENKERILRGIAASPGICIGKAYLVDREGVEVIPKYFVHASHIPQEIKRFQAAVKLAQDELRQIIEETPEDLKIHTGILETHLLLFQDKMLYGRTIEDIQQEGVNAEWALKKVVSEVKATFQGMADEYLKERVTDIVHVSDRILHHLTGNHHVKIADIDKRVILVARDLSPADTSQIQLEHIKGFLTDLGGRTSHTGIIARSLGLPAVLGLSNATALIRTDDLIIVDGSAGLVIVNPTEETLVEYDERQGRYEAYRAQLSRDSHLEARTQDDTFIRVMGNIELPEEVVSVIDNGGDGVGLYRTEFQYLSRRDLPSEFELFDKYRDVVEVMAGRPVVIRTLDINGDKALQDANTHIEVNPALGLRAIRYCLKHPEMFKTQLRAILRAAAFGDVRILFPMITGMEELKEARRLLAEAALGLQREKVAHNPDIPVGIMMEVPSAVIIADQLAARCDFFSIGTNDLMQYSLAIDRGNRHVAYLWDPLHPAILRMVRRVAEVAREAGIQVAMCGEMAGEPIHVPILIGLGIPEWSMNPNAIPVVKRMVRSLAAAPCRDFIGEISGMTCAREITKLAWKTFGQALTGQPFAD
jgi:phosphotransferase system enzyme I (PtsI)